MRQKGDKTAQCLTFCQLCSSPKIHPETCRKEKKNPHREIFVWQPRSVAYIKIFIDIEGLYYPLRVSRSHFGMMQ